MVLKWGYIKTVSFVLLSFIGYSFLYYLGFRKFASKKLDKTSLFYKGFAICFDTTPERVKEVFDLYDVKEASDLFSGKVDIDILKKELHYLRGKREETKEGN